MTSSNNSFIDELEAGQLSEKEIFWRDHYNFLKDRGYTLRNRYNPDWVPSWKIQKEFFKKLERLRRRTIDSRKCGHSQSWSLQYHLLLQYAPIVDAIRADGSLVVLKEIKLHSDQEIPIGKLFSSGTLAKHPKNHCVPFMDVIEPSEGSGSAFVVMPYLLDTDNPPFETIGEVVAYFEQIFERFQYAPLAQANQSDTTLSTLAYLQSVVLKMHPISGNLPGEVTSWDGFAKRKQAFDFMKELVDDMTNPDP
ncbi:hypothetical protein C0993_000979 [Termitomyces sp. T159_Od127]|nr:hypothetical protein C0993_000979 [Termitomyces sp. T159_Od127]